jgi:hypothetical protein
MRKVLVGLALLITGISMAHADHPRTHDEVYACSALLVSNSEVLYFSKRPVGTVTMENVVGEQSVIGHVDVQLLFPKPQGHAPFDVCANAGGVDFVLKSNVEAHNGVLAITFSEAVPDSSELWGVCSSYRVKVAYRNDELGDCRGRKVLETLPFHFSRAWVAR